MDSYKREGLISQIQDYDQQIQSYVEEDYPKTNEELLNMTITELRDWLDRRIAELQFLVEEDINNNRND